MPQRMRRFVAAASLAVAALTASCGNDPPAATPTPAVSYAPGAAPAYQNGNNILGPAGDARDTVDQLNDMQEGTSNQTGGGAPGEFGP